MEVYYFNENSRFKKNDWNYYKKLSENFEINSTTNSIESINKKLKYACNDGKITFQKACQTLCNFKADFRSEFEYKVLLNNMNLRQNHTIENNKIKIQIIQEYNRLSYIERGMYTLEFAYKFGTKNSLAFYAGDQIFDEYQDDSSDEILNFTDL